LKIPWLLGVSSQRFIRAAAYGTPLAVDTQVFHQPNILAEHCLTASHRLPIATALLLPHLLSSRLTP
jgi:hypothetical protein